MCLGFRYMLNRTFKYCFLPIILLAICLHAYSQTEILDANVPGLKWYQIKTPHFRIIFEGTLFSEGHKMANTMEALYEPGSQSLGITPKKISIILQNYNSISNGFVTQSPRRSEFYTMPTQDYNFSGVLNWMDLLAVHEFRHVVQFDRSINKFNKALFYLLGYSASSTMAHISVPEWFWEGDAVVIETALTKGGRGRIPNFGILMRTNTLERGSFNYYRQYLRSFRYQIQDHYTFGYYMTSYLRRHYGEDIIARTTKETWAWPFIPFRFSSKLKKYTGKGLVKNYNGMMLELDSLWRSQVDSREFTIFKRINFRYSKAYTEYSYPHYLNDGSVLALKSGIGDIPTFISFDKTGKDHKIMVPGVINNTGMLSVANDIIAWNEIEFDPRWRSRSYSVIKIYDLKNRELRRITKKSRFSSAALSPDGKLIITVETSHDSRHKIVIIDSGSGKVIGEVPNPENYYFLNPRWSSDGTQIVAVKQTKEGKCLWHYDLGNSTGEDLWSLNYENIGNPFMFENYIFYNSSYDGIDNIYVLDLNSRKRFRVTSSKYGSYNAVISKDGRKMLYNDFTKDGHDVVEIDLNPVIWEPIEHINPSPEDYFRPITEQEGNINILDSVKEESFPVDRYRLGTGIINPYSWGAVLQSTDLDLFIGLSSRDIMGTSVLDLGYAFDAGEQTGRWIGNFSYQGIYPILNFSGYTGGRAITERFPILNQEGEMIGDTLSDVSWRERGLVLGVELPFRLTRSKYLESLNIGFNYNYSYVKDYTAYQSYRKLDMQGDGQLLSNIYYLSYRRMLRTSKRDIYGKFGQFVYLHYEHTPWSASEYLGEMFASQLRLFFPGFAKHHSIHIRSGYILQNTDYGESTYLFQNPIFWTRGYSYRLFDEYLNNSINYTLPIMYPDFHVGPVLNIQRIYANIFYDHGIRFLHSNPSTGIAEQSDHYRSLGVEVSFDFNFMRFLSLFNMGVRYVYALDDPGQPHRWQLLIGDFGL